MSVGPISAFVGWSWQVSDSCIPGKLRTAEEEAAAAAEEEEAMLLGWCCCGFAWLSVKLHCLLIAMNEGSFSWAVELLGGGGGVIAAVEVAVGGGVGVCALPLLCSLPDSSLASCWYISSTMGFHNRTLALMNQFDT